MVYPLLYKVSFFCAILHYKKASIFYPIIIFKKSGSGLVNYQ